MGFQGKGEGPRAEIIAARGGDRWPSGKGKCKNPLYVTRGHGMLTVSRRAGYSRAVIRS